jgi:hypothetical protein
MGLNPRSKGDDMADPRHIAGLAGPTLMAVTTSEALNLDIWSPADPALVYLNGGLLFVAGLAIIRTHNVWRLRWTLVVTVLGWAALTAGLVRIRRTARSWARPERPMRSSSCFSWWAPS